MKNFFFRTTLAAAFAASFAAVSPASASITYFVDQIISGSTFNGSPATGSVVGTITTDGATGELQPGDITAWNLKLTGNGGVSATLDPSNSGVDDYGFPLGLSATTHDLSFDFDPTQDALFAIQINGGMGTGRTYWCNASFTGPCFRGKSVVPVLFSDNSSVYDMSPTTEEVIGVAVPEPATWAMLILGVAAIGFAARRRRDGVALAA